MMETEQSRVTDVFNDFQTRADAFTAKILAAYDAPNYKSSKVIHDCVWGTVTFYPWELRIIDSPLIQRLRKINQLGMALYTYPSAQHSRFEHTLGVVAVLNKMISGLNQDGSPLTDRPEHSIPDDAIRKLRLAALLHDVGHCFFSHVSESIYGSLPSFRQLKQETPLFKKAAPHEILGYLIVTSQSFTKFFRDQVNYPFAPGETAASVLSDIGRMIIGVELPVRFDPATGQPIRDYYMTQLINGEFDADSLDYLRRDSYTTGIALSYHIDRLLYKMRLVEYAEGGVRGNYLTVSSSGVSTVEEMVFSKLQLTRHIYHHQKVMAAETLLSEAIEGLRLSGRLQHPCDFLNWCDGDIMHLASTDDPDMASPLSSLPLVSDPTGTVGSAIADIAARRLPKKVMSIHCGVVSSLDHGASRQFQIDDLRKIITAEDLPDKVLNEANRICALLNRPMLTAYDIHFVAPRLKMAKDFTDSLVASNDGRLVPLSDVMDMAEWVKDFTRQSWAAYVFATRENAAVGVATLRVLNELGVVFDREKLLLSLKNADAIKNLEAYLAQYRK